MRSRSQSQSVRKGSGSWRLGVGVAAATGTPIAAASALDVTGGAWIETWLPGLALAVVAAVGLGLGLSRPWDRYKTAPGKDHAAGPEQPREAPDIAADAEALSDALFSAHDDLVQLRAQLEAQADLIVDRGPDGRITFANSAFRAAHPDCRVGQVLDECRPVAEQDRRDAASYVTQITDVESGDAARVIAWLESPIRDRDGNSAGIRAVGRDVTGFVETAAALGAARDEALSASRAKQRFLAAMSHEVRTPLNGILGLADLLLDDELTPAQRNHTRAIRQSALTLATLINEVLDFSRIEAGRLELTEENASPADMIRDVCELLAPRAFDKALGLGVHVAADMPELVHIDAGRFKQVLTNLLGNAIKFTDNGAVAVDCCWISAASDDDDAGALHLSVRDTGRGVAVEDRERIFDEFETGAAGHGAGAGLGLAICRRIARAMGGDVRLSTDEAHGALFTAVLPCRERAPARQTGEPLAGMNVAVCMSEPVEAGALIETCADLGAQMSEPGDADIVLTDGDVADPDWSQARALRLVAHGARPDADELAERGFAGYLARPVRTESLLARIAARAVGEEPAAANDQAGIRGASAPPPEDRLPCAEHPLRVLLAEDDTISAMLMVAILQRMGHHVTHVSDGKAACDLLSAGDAPFDAALLDIRLPGRSGLEIAVATRDAGATAIPLVAVTADALPENRAAALKAGFAAHLAKPIDPHRLAALLASLAPQSASAPQAAVS